MIRVLALLCLALFLPTHAGATPREVEIEATGLTRQDAITQGLVQALEQVSGVALVSLQSAKTELASQVTNDRTATRLTQQQQSETAKLTGGFISAYRVTATSDTMPVNVRMMVTVEVFQAKGLGNDTRRRIAVATFGSGDGRANPGAELLRTRITARLVQARRFAVVDRGEDRVYAQEMALLRSGNAPLAERTRVGQVIGADYVVTGKLRQTAGTRTDRVLEITGETVTSSTAAFAEADFQVIEIATRQIKWTGTFGFTGNDALDRIGARIADEITQSIYPLRLIRFDDPAELIVNQGGDGLQVGQRFRAMVMGEMMVDPYTNEPLGQVEKEAGIVEIRRVDSKLSYAALIAGQLPAPGGNDVSVVLRPAPPARAAPAAQARRPAVEAPTTTKLPFDR